MAEIAVLGYGNVGWGVSNVINANKDIIQRKAGEPVKIKYIFDKRNFPGDVMESYITHDIESVLNDTAISVIVEALGGTEPAVSFAKRALMSGKSYVTSNKELVAAYGAELLEIARSRNVSFLFEASVGGGIPIIRPLTDSITADDVLEISGILNGTTNYILTKMENESKSFEEALADAQKTGYAESNPDADIDGFDAARKIAILLSMVVGQTVDYKDIYTEGIRCITADALLYAKKIGAKVKLMATAAKIDEGFAASVEPMLVPESNLMAWVKGVQNCILVRGNAVGELYFTGSGAGKLPTASAIIADVIDSIRHPGANANLYWSTQRFNLAGGGVKLQKLIITEYGDISMKEQNAVDMIKELYSSCEIVNIGNQKGIGFITQPMQEHEFKQKAESLGLRSIRPVLQIRLLK